MKIGQIRSRIIKKKKIPQIQCIARGKAAGDLLRILLTEAGGDF